MNFDTQQALDRLQMAISEREFEDQEIGSWQEYDVAIADTDDDEELSHWRRLPSESEQEFRRVEPHRRVVITRFAKELSWLFQELKKIHPSEIERHTNHDFYAELADEANLYIEHHRQDVTASRLMEAVLDKVRKIYR